MAATIWHPRLEMINMSAGMGGVFARTATEFTERIRLLGPNPIKRSVHGEVQSAAG